MFKICKGHSGFYSHESCEIKDKNIDGRLAMAALECQSRTDQLFNPSVPENIRKP